MQKPTYKILIACHKPTLLPKGENYIPIHCGRALGSLSHKDGTINDEEYQWLLNNTCGDHVGDNISLLNRQFNEITAIYSAWKNYDHYGTPDYIGLCHYRRILKDEDVLDYQEYEIIANFEDLEESIIEHFSTCHHVDTLDKVLAKVKKIDGYATITDEFKKQNRGYFRNIFLMKKEIFFEYCEFIFPLLFDLHNNLDYTKLSYYSQRMPAFISERLTSLFILKKMKENKKVKEIEVEIADIPALLPLKPTFKENNIPVVFSSDENYAPYLCVAIASLVENASEDYNYDICIFCQNFTESIKNKILEFSNANISIRFIDIAPLLHKYSTIDFHINSHFTILTYFRIFIPELFSSYSKVLYLDCDIIILEDVSKLYYEDIQNYALAAVCDIEVVRQTFNQTQENASMLEYIKNTLQLTKQLRYFQAGVLILDIPKLIDFDFTQKCLAKLSEIGSPRYVDQDVLNSLFDGKIYYLAVEWNVEWHIPLVSRNLMNELPSDLYQEYMQSRKSPKIIHYAGIYKPWQNANVELDLAHIWWQYARRTPFYEKFLRNLDSNKTSKAIQSIDAIKKDLYFYDKIRLSYYKHKFLSAITFGNTRKKHLMQCQSLDKRIKAVRRYLSKPL